MICPLPQLPPLPSPMPSSRRRPASRRSSSSSLSFCPRSLFSRVPQSPSSHAALLLSTQRPTHDRTKRGRTDRVTHTDTPTTLSLSLSLSLSLVAKRSYVVPLFAVGVVRTSLSMISCKGPLRSSYSFGRIGPSRHVGYYAADAGNVMKAITISFILSSLWFPSSCPCTHSVHVTKKQGMRRDHGGRNR